MSHWYWSSCNTKWRYCCRNLLQITALMAHYATRPIMSRPTLLYVLYTFQYRHQLYNHDYINQVKSFPDIWSVLAPRQILYQYRKARAPINVHLETRTSLGYPQFPPSTFETVNRPPEVTNSPRRVIEPYYIFPSNGRPRRNTGPDPISAAKSHVDSRKSGSIALKASHALRSRQ